MQIMVRAEKFTKLLETRKKIDTCFQAAALATGCTVEIAWEDPYKELRNNDLICEKFAEYAKAFGRTYLPLIPGGSSGASTDQGNVSYEVPQIHPVFGIDVASPDIGNHHAGFTEAGGTRDSFDKTLDFAAILAATGIEIAKDAELRSRIHESHKAMVKGLLG
ncbi:hypothetical protein KEM56_003143 [Ascosphaera pollenicola]|nr:hypothetical protein KEM56_003143 [Ascosphaera pollenicola]